MQPHGFVSSLSRDSDLPKRNNLRCSTERIHKVQRPVTPGSGWGPYARKGHVWPRITAWGVSGEAGLGPRSLLQLRRRSGPERAGGAAGGNLGLAAGGRNPRVQLRGLASRWRQGQLRQQPQLPGSFRLSEPAPRLHLCVSRVLLAAPCPGPGYQGIGTAQR